MARCQSIFNLSADNLRLVELCAGVLLGVLSLKSVLLGVLRHEKRFNCLPDKWSVFQLCAPYYCPLKKVEKFWKKFLTGGEGVWYINQALAESRVPCKLNNVNKRTHQEKRDSKKYFEKLRLADQWIRFTVSKETVDTIYWEFDPGSGRTLAACLTHASRTKHFRFEIRQELDLT